MKRPKLCRSCKRKDLLLYLDLGKQPLANSYHKENNLPRYPLEVMLCTNCYHSQLSIVIDPDSMFRDYLYVSGTTQTFRKHCSDLAKDAVSRIKKKSINVLDIACNDGTQLEYFRNLGCSIYGVDPAFNLRKITKQKKIPVLVEYWTKHAALSFKKKFDIITATNVFAHVDDIDQFLKACRLALAKDGIIVIEFPYAKNMVKHNEFDTIYHEHLSYFLVNSFSTLASRLGFQIIDVLETPIHGGSIRFFIKDHIGRHSSKVEECIKNEGKRGLFKFSTYKRFSESVIKNKNRLEQITKKLRKRNKKIIGYAASAKGNTMLNYVDIDLDYIVDDNSLKWDFKTPGKNIPIVSPHIMKQEKDELYIVILAWNFYKEIAKHIVEIRGKRQDYCIMYVPNAKILTLLEASKVAISA